MFVMIDFMSISAVITYYESVTVLHAEHIEMDVDKVSDFLEPKISQERQTDKGFTWRV